MKFTRFLIGLSLLMAFEGCSPREEKIEGSIFVVTQGRDNVKLGDVGVFLYDSQTIEPYVKKPVKDLADEMAQNTVWRQKFEGAGKLVNETGRKFDPNYDFRSQEDELTATRPEFSKLDEDELSNLQNKTGLTISDTNRLNELKSEKENISKEQALWDEWHPVFLKQVAEEKRILNEWQEDTDVKLRNWPTAESQEQTWFENLPVPRKYVRTDADGKFALLIPREGDFYLAAQAQRLIPDKIERYYWLIRVHSDGKSAMQVILSNDNLITAGSADSAVHFPEP